MQTLNNAELAFLAMLGHPELTTKVLRVYAAKSYLFTEMFHPHLNLMWNTYVALLKKYKKDYGLKLSPDISAAGLAEAVAADNRLPAELKAKCDAILQKLTAGSIPDVAQGERLIKNLMELEANRKLVSQLNANADLLALQQSLDASKRTLSIMDDGKEDESEAGVIVNPFRDIKKLVRRYERVPTGINWMDELSSGGGREGDLWLILGAPSGGKCLDPDTDVLMYSGQVKKVKDICAGEQVMGPDSKPRTVLSTTSGEAPMYRIRMKRGESFVCNDKHTLTLACDYVRGVSVLGRHVAKDELFDIDIEDYLKLPESTRHHVKAVRTAVEFQKRPAPELDPYFAGLYTGDGAVLCSKLTSMDPEVLDYCREYAEKMGWGCRTSVRDEKAVDLCFNGHGRRRNAPIRYIRKHLLKDGAKHVSDDYKFGSKAVRTAFLAGVIDADGYAHHGGYDLVLKGEALARDVCFIARSLGYGVTIRQTRKTCCNTGKEGVYWRLNISGNFDDFPVRVPRRKSVRKLHSDWNPGFVGFTVEPLGVGPYSGFMLDGDGRFLLGDFTVTHNSIVCVQYCCAQAMLGNNVLWATYEQTVEGDLAERMVANITDTSLEVIRDVGFDNLPQDVQDKFWASVAGVDDRLTAMDMTRVQADPQDPEDYGGIKSIWKQFRKMKEAGHAPKTVIIDWFGSMMSRIAANLCIDLSTCYRFKAQEEINTLIQFARTEKIHIIVMHQLDVKAAGARPTYLADATHAQDMHNLQNFFDLVIILGKKDVNNIMYVSNPKARKGGRIVRTVRMVGEKSRLVMEDGWLPNRDGNFYKPGSTSTDSDARGAAEEYARELD